MKKINIITSPDRAKILQLIYENGVIPSNVDLISRALTIYNDSNINKKYIKNALKKLNENGFIEMKSIFRHRKVGEQNKKDLYVLTLKGLSSLKKFAVKNKSPLKKHNRIPEKIKSEDYRFFYNISVSRLYFSKINCYYLTRFEVLELYGETLTRELTQLKFHGAIKTNEGIIIPIYYIKDNNYKCRFSIENKFFKELNKKQGVSTGVFNFIALADDESIVDTLLLKQCYNYSQNFRDRTDELLFNPFRERPYSNGYLLCLNMMPSAIEYLYKIDKNNSIFKNHAQSCYDKYKNIFKNSHGASENHFMLYLNVVELQKEFQKELSHISREKNALIKYQRQYKRGEITKSMFDSELGKTKCVREHIIFSVKENEKILKRINTNISCFHYYCLG